MNHDRRKPAEAAEGDVGGGWGCGTLRAVGHRSGESGAGVPGVLVEEFALQQATSDSVLALSKASPTVPMEPSRLAGGRRWPNTPSSSSIHGRCARSAHYGGQAPPGAMSIASATH